LASAETAELLEFGELEGGRPYSAACETFMRPAASSTDLTMLW
jgi:hypothetical protein